MHHAKISFATKMFDILDSIEYPVKNSSSNWLAGIVFCIWHIQRNMRSFAIITINLSTARRYDNIWLTNWDDDDKINKFVSLFIGFIINLWNKIFIKQGIYLDGLYWNVMIKVWYPLKASRLLIHVIDLTLDAVGVADRCWCGCRASMPWSYCIELIIGHLLLPFAILSLLFPLRLLWLATPNS